LTFTIGGRLNLFDLTRFWAIPISFVLLPGGKSPNNLRSIPFRGLFAFLYPYFYHLLYPLFAAIAFLPILFLQSCPLRQRSWNRSSCWVALRLFYRGGEFPEDDLGWAQEADAGGAGTFHADAAGDVQQEVVEVVFAGLEFAAVERAGEDGTDPR